MKSVRSVLLEQGFIAAHEIPNSSLEFRIQCPECHNPKKKCYVSAEGGGLNCFHCGYASGWKTFARRYYPTDPKEQAIEEFVEKAHELLGEREEVLQYLYDRGLTDETLLKQKIGLCLPGAFELSNKQAGQDAGLYYPDGNFFLQNRIIIPYFQDGAVYTVRGRLIPGARHEVKMMGLKGVSPGLYVPNGVKYKSDEQVIITEGECLPGYTEVFTPEGWVRLDSGYSGPVLTCDAYGNGEFQTPIVRIEKSFAENLLCYSNAQKFFTSTTSKHNFVVDYSNRRFKVAGEDIKPHHKIPRTVLLDSPGINISNDELALMLAFSADGTLDKRASGDFYCRFAFKKQRKIERLTSLLNNLGIDYSGPNLYKGGNQGICFLVPEKYKFLIKKILPHEWLGLFSLHQRLFIIGEMVEWDGNRVNGKNQVEYSSKYKQNADWMQLIGHTSGFVSTIINRENQYGKWFKVSILFGKTHTSGQTLHAHYESSEDQKVYCLQVPNGNLLIRQRDCIYLTGNCDALILIQNGIQAVGIPGAQNSQKEWFKPYKNLYIALDGDEAGKKGISKLVRDIHEVRVVNMPEGYDVNDYILKFGPESFKVLAGQADLFIQGRKQRDDRFSSVVEDFSNWAWSNGERLGPKIGWSPKLDEAFFGWSPGLYLLGGESSAGKSKFLVKSLFELCVENPDDSVGVYLSYDDSLRDTTSAILALHSGITMNEVKTPRYSFDHPDNPEKKSPEKLAQYNKAVESLKEINNLVLRDVTYGRSVQYLRYFFENLRKKYPTKNIVVFIDSLAKITPDGSKEPSESGEGGERNYKAFLAKEIKYFCNLYNLSIVAPTDLRKMNGRGRPGPDDLKDAAELRYEANNLFFLYNDRGVYKDASNMYKEIEGGVKCPIVELIIPKNKATGRETKILYMMNPAVSDFQELTGDDLLLYTRRAAENEMQRQQDRKGYRQ